MARTINDIQQSIITDLQTYFPKLSTSKVAEWTFEVESFGK